MSNEKVPSGLAASVKILADSIQTTFGAAVIVIIFFGMALFVLTCGFGNVSSELRVNLIKWLIISMGLILLVLFLLRLFKPTGLSGPPQPVTEDIEISESSYSPSGLSSMSSRSLSSSSRSSSMTNQED